MSFFFVWNPLTMSYVLLVESIDSLESTTCSICKSKISRKVLKSKILFKEKYIDVPEDLYRLNIEQSKIKRREIHIPVLADEWTIPITKDHDFDLREIDNLGVKKAFIASINSLIREVRRKILIGKHVYCFSIFGLKGRGTISHPQIRCFEFDHQIMLPRVLRNYNGKCPLCWNLNAQKNILDKLFESKNIIAYKPYMKTSPGELIIVSKTHTKLESIGKSLANQIAYALIELLKSLSDEIDEDDIVFVSYDFLNNAHIYIRIITLQRCADNHSKITQILSDRDVPLFFGF